jgi:acyl carrier protein
MERIMDKKEIREKFIGILKKYTKQNEVWDNATGSSEILQDLKINSSRFVDIILDIEDTFDITVDDETMDNIITIDNGVEAISNLLAE